MEEVAGLLVDGFLQTLLRRGIGWHVADTSGCKVVLSEGIGQPLANFGGFCYLGWRRRPFGIPVAVTISPLVGKNA